MTTSPTPPGAAAHSCGTRPIIVGVDGSASSLEALTWAVPQAQLIGVQVHAVIAWHYPAVYGMYAMSDEVDWADNAKQTIEAAVKEALGGDIDDVKSYVVQGHPAQVLVDASADAALLVVGNHGHGGFVETLLGSVSQQVVTHATCPVLVVRAHATPESATVTHDGLSR